MGVKLRDLKKKRKFELKKTWVATSEAFNMHLAACFRSLLLDLCGPLLLASNVQCMVNQHASQQDRGVHFQRTAMASLTWAAMVLVSTKTPLQASLSLVLSHWNLVPKWGQKTNEIWALTCREREEMDTK